MGVRIRVFPLFKGTKVYLFLRLKKLDLSTHLLVPNLIIILQYYYLRVHKIYKNPGIISMTQVYFHLMN